jgi:hypothetical protein
MIILKMDLKKILQENVTRTHSTQRRVDFNGFLMTVTNIEVLQHDIS